MPTFYIEQFGCRATQADGAAIERQLREQGCELASHSRAADVVILNTCTVTAAADTQAREAIRKLHAANPSTCIIVTGCYAQRAPEELAALPGVSFVVGNSHKPQIPNLLRSIASLPLHPTSSDLSVGAQHAAPLLAILPHSVGSSGQATILTGDIFDLSEVLVAPVLGGEGNHTRPTLKIQDGCNARCSFCVVPFVRGKSRSLPPEKVVAEIQRLADSGYREIVLSGINLGAYGRDLSPRVTFLELLLRILDETPVERLRVSSLEPLDVSLTLIDLIASSDRLAPHFHMPLQSASDRILAAMHRWYRAEHYARRVELIHERLPHAAVGADVITGFPGESEADHAATLRFIAERPFTYLHVFSYSPRPGTKAAALPHQVPGRVIKRRARELRALAETKSAEFRASQIGRTLRVLTLRRDPQNDPSCTPGLSENYLAIQLHFALMPHDLFTARVTHAEGKNLCALPLEPVLAASAAG